MTEPTPQPAPKKPWYKKWWVWVIIVILVIVIASAAGGGDSDNASSDKQTNGDTSTAQQNTNSATSGAIGDTLNTGKADVTLTNARAEADALGTQLTCADVTINNTSDKDTVTLNGLADWKLADPNGVSRDLAFGPPTTYDPVDLAPGGTYSGVVCFESDRTPGEHTFHFKEGLSFSGDEVTWTANL